MQNSNVIRIRRPLRNTTVSLHGDGAGGAGGARYSHACMQHRRRPGFHFRESRCSKGLDIDTEFFNTASLLIRANTYGVRTPYVVFWICRNGDSLEAGGLKILVGIPFIR